MKPNQSCLLTYTYNPTNFIIASTISAMLQNLHKLVSGPKTWNAKKSAKPLLKKNLSVHFSKAKLSRKMCDMAQVVDLVGREGLSSIKKYDK